jgi:hypothetical protein
MCGNGAEVVAKHARCEGPAVGPCFSRLRVRWHVQVGKVWNLKLCQLAIEAASGQGVIPSTVDSNRKTKGRLVPATCVIVTEGLL